MSVTTVPVRQQPLRAGLRSGDRDVRRQSALDHQGADHGERISGNRTGGIAGRHMPPAACQVILTRDEQRRLTNQTGATTMADVTYYVALPFLQDDSGSPVAGAAEECQSPTTALRRAEMMSRMRRQHRRRRLQPQRRSHDRRIRRCEVAAEIRQRAGRSERALTALFGLTRFPLTPRAAAAPCAHTWRCRPLPARGRLRQWVSRIATPAEAPAVTVRPSKHEGQAIDRLLQRGRLGPGIGLAEIPQQQRELVAAEPADHVGCAHLAQAASRRWP